MRKSGFNGITGDFPTTSFSSKGAFSAGAASGDKPAPSAAPLDISSVTIIEQKAGYDDQGNLIPARKKAAEQAPQPFDFVPRGAANDKIFGINKYAVYGLGAVAAIGIGYGIYRMVKS